MAVQAAPSIFLPPTLVQDGHSSNTWQVSGTRLPIIINKLDATNILNKVAMAPILRFHSFPPTWEVVPAKVLEISTIDQAIKDSSIRTTCNSSGKKGTLNPRFLRRLHRHVARWPMAVVVDGVRAVW